MITKREISHLMTAFRSTAPLARDYSESTVKEMRAAVDQWRNCVNSVANMLEVAQENAKKPTFNKNSFLHGCGVQTAEADEVLILLECARKHTGITPKAEVIARVALSDALALYDIGNFPDAKRRALKSLAYSVGEHSEIYKDAAK